MANVHITRIFVVMLIVTISIFSVYFIGFFNYLRYAQLQKSNGYVIAYTEPNPPAGQQDDPPCTGTGTLTCNSITTANTTIDVGQIVYITVNEILGGTGIYSGNWIYASANMSTSNTISFLPQSSGLGTWQQTNPYPANVYEHSCVSDSGYAYCIGGFDATHNIYTNSIYYAQLTSTGTTAWQQTNPYPANVYFHSCVSDSGYAYCIGGYDTIHSIGTNSVYYAQLTSTGTTAWQQTNPYPANVYFHSCVSNSGYAYCIGGTNTISSTDMNSVYYAQLTSTGTTAWQQTNPYPVNIIGHSCVSDSGYAYCIGGFDATHSTFTNSVYYAQLTSTGTTAWQQTNPYPIRIYQHSCTSNSGYAYCISGYDGTPDNIYTNSVYYAQLTSTGTSAWQQTNPYPANVYGHSCISNSGYVYCIGGENGTTSTYTNSVYYAPILQNINLEANVFSQNQIYLTFNGGTDQDLITTGSKTVYGSWSFNAFLKDTLSNTITTNDIPIITINPALSPILTNTGNVIDLGQRTMLTASVGGTPSYTYNFLISNSLGIVANALYSNTMPSNSFSFIPLSIGTFNANVIVKDQASTPVTENSVSNTIVVNPALSNSILVSNSGSMTLGSAIIFNALASGGTPPYTYNFIITDPGTVVYATGFTSSNSLDYTTTSAGSYTAEVETKDSASTPVITTNSINFTVASISVPSPPSTYSITLSDNANTSVLSDLPVFTAYVIDSSGGIVSINTYYQNQLPATLTYMYPDMVNLSFACYFSAGNYAYTYANVVYGIGFSACGRKYFVYTGSYEAIYSAHQTTFSSNGTSYLLHLTINLSKGTIPVHLHPNSSLFVNFKNEDAFIVLRGRLNVNQTGNLTVENTTASTPQFKNHMKLLSISIAPPNDTIANITMGYNCNTPPHRISPYVLSNGMWKYYPNYTLNKSACTITLSIKSDPTIGIFANSTNATTATSNATSAPQQSNAITSNSTSVQTTIPTSMKTIQPNTTTLPQSTSQTTIQHAHNTIYFYPLIAAAVVAIAIIIIIAHMRARKRSMH